VPPATDTRDDTATEAPGRRRWLTMTAGGFLLLIVVASLIVVLWPSPEANTPTSPPGPTEGGEPGPVPSAGPTTVPTTAPEDVTWELVNGIAVPRSASAGPTQIDGPLHHGFAHTPEGALMAALQIYTRGGFTEGDGWRAVTMEQVMPGPGRQVYINAREKVDDLQPPPEGWGQVAGFRFQSYSPDRAVIEIAERFQSGSIQVHSSTVVWHDGDWRLQLQPDGELGPYTSAVPNLSGFVKFSGV
jgi:hypothetical protein